MAHRYIYNLTGGVFVSSKATLECNFTLQQLLLEDILNGILILFGNVSTTDVTGSICVRLLKAELVPIMK